eukprot:10158154-Alexandrium_andersonii.AAC.1
MELVAWTTPSATRGCLRTPSGGSSCRGAITCVCARAAMPRWQSLSSGEATQWGTFAGHTAS